MANGSFRYPGVTGVLSASLTVGLGINPSVTTISIPPAPGVLQPRGTAVWRYGGAVVRSFPNSIVDSVQVSRSGGFTTWDVAILDRRWAWTTGQISGEYNTRKKGVIITAREKTPQQLATLCLQAMKETTYNVSNLPNDDRPFIQWDLEVPAKALAELCDLYGCAVSLNINNSVSIVKLGEGAVFPAGWLTNDATIDPANVPKSLRVVTTPTRWQVDLPLDNWGYEADGTLNADGTMQSDGTFKKASELSYKPAAGWESFDGDDEFGGDDNPLTKAQRSLAVAHINKTFRVRQDELAADAAASSGDRSRLNIEGPLVAIEELDQILPLIPELLDTWGAEGDQHPLPAFVWGRFYDGESLGSNTTDEADVTYGDYTSDLKYKGSVSIDAELGMVTFSEPMYTVDQFSAGIVPPKLWLRCVINVRLKDTRSAQRQFKEVTVDPSAPTEPKYLVRDDIVPEWRQETGGAWTNNDAAITTQANYYLAQELRNYQALLSANATYPSLVVLNTDGAMRQIQYGIDGEGFATSSVSRNGEFARYAVSYDEARRIQKQTAALERESRERKKPKRVRRTTE